nr:Mariner Mos1 transposase [Hymenolepis microstoma]CUU98183.1 Mariner Mos1 transposase [Hymenolepis microstoma]CUU98239.1 Mariner Mos1 transposase [Hymenolepis microstoma]
MYKKNYQNHWVGISEQAISKRLKQLGIIEKEGYWVLRELKPRRDVERRRLFACEQLLEGQARKEFLHRIVTGDEKWVNYNNPNPSPSAENHGDCQWSYCYVNTSADEYQKSCFVFGRGTSLA